jgi:hypothetical protein
MKLKEIKKYVIENYDKLPISKFSDGYGDKAPVLVEGVAIWGRDDTECFDTDVEVLLVTKEGKLIWVYASGCSCYTAIDHKKLHTFSIKKFTIKWKKQPLLELVLNLWKDGVPVIKTYNEYAYE